MVKVNEQALVEELVADAAAVEAHTEAVSALVFLAQ
jgi:hypothetical protein